MAGGDVERGVVPVRVIFLGPPGVGKGTQAARLAARLGIPKISTGDMLRTAIAEGTPLGREAAPLMDRGDLVPDGLLTKLIDERIQQPDCANGYILDGFPRTLPQAEGFENGLGPDSARSLVFKIDMLRERLLGRLSGRRWCPKCQATFHVLNDPPKRDGICDRCGTSLIQREDDKEAVVARRLHEYDERTRPVTRYYERAGDVHRIAGDRSADDVFADILQVVEAERTASHA